MSRHRALLASLLLLAALAPLAFAAAAARHVVLISIDGLRPEFYLDDAYAAPALRALVAAGSHARAATPPFPSVTYPGHATIVTGVRPARHGIPFNVTWSPAAGSSGRWYEEAADLRAPALWDVARAAGLTTAAVSWPVTLGARIDWLIPERDYYQRSEPVELLRRATTPGLLERLGVAAQPETFKSVVRWDEFLTAAATGIIKGMRPNLLLVHLVQADYYQHRGGREGVDVKPAVARVDAHVAAIVSALREAGIAERTAVIVTGDHGFQDVARTVHPNEILFRAGLRRCPWSGTNWLATAHDTGGSSGVFVNDDGGGPGVAALAEETLRRQARDRYTIVSRRELDALGAMPGVAFALEAALGWAFGGGCSENETAGVRGTHGFLPSRPSMSTGFIASGAGVKAGVSLERIGLVDVGPTAARLLGLTMSNAEGRVLTELLP